MRELIALSSELEGERGRTVVYSELFATDVMLQTVLFAAALYARTRFCKELLLTSLWRTDGIHSTLRAADTDVDDQRLYKGIMPGQAAELTKWINSIFTYDLERPEFKVAVYGVNDSKGEHWDHIHFQVCWGHRTVLTPRLGL